MRQIHLTPMDWLPGRDDPTAIIVDMMCSYLFDPVESVELTVVCGRENMRLLRQQGKPALAKLLRARFPTIGPLEIRFEQAPRWSQTSISLPSSPTIKPTAHQGVE